MPFAPSSSNASEEPLPPAYEGPLMSDDYTLSPASYAPPAYDFSNARATQASSQPSNTSPSATTAALPTYSALAEYPSHDELQDRLPTRKSIFSTGKVCWQYDVGRELAIVIFFCCCKKYFI